MKIILFIIIQFVFINFGFAQWSPLIRNINDETGKLYNKNGVLYCFQNFSGVSISLNQGETWSTGKTGLPISYLTSFTFINNLLVVTNDNAGNNETYLSSNNGNSWSLQSVLNNEAFTSMFYDGIYLFAGGIYSNPIYRSADNGLSWNVSSTGIPNTYFQPIGFCEAPGALFYYGKDAIYRTIDHGLNWTQIQTGIAYPYYSNMISSDGKLLLTLNDHFYLVSNDNGNTWSQIPSIVNAWVTDLLTINHQIFAATNSNGIYKLENDTVWTSLSCQSNNPIVSITQLGLNLFALYNGGIYRSSDYFNTCIKVNNDPIFWNPIIHNADNRLYAVNRTTSNELYYLENNGQHWNHLTIPIIYGDVSCLSNKDSLILMGTSWDGYFGTGFGSSWNTIPFPGGPNYIFQFLAIDTAVFVATQSGIYRSNNIYSNIFDDINTGDLYGVYPNIFHRQIYSIDTLNGSIFVGTNIGIYKSDDFGNNWTVVDTLKAIKIISFHDFLLAKTAYGLYCSDSLGNNWSPYISNLPSGIVVNTFFKDEHSLYLGSDYSGVYMSTNGLVWTDIGQGVEHNSVYSFAEINGSLYIGTNNGIWERALSEMSINETTQKPYNVLVFPNPTNGLIIIEIEQKLNYNKLKITINNMVGQQLIKKEANGNKIKINIYDFIPGTYILKIEYENNCYVKKIIKI